MDVTIIDRRPEDSFEKKILRGELPAGEHGSVRCGQILRNTISDNTLKSAIRDAVALLTPVYIYKKKLSPESVVLDQWFIRPMSHYLVDQCFLKILYIDIVPHMSTNQKVEITMNAGFTAREFFTLYPSQEVVT